MKVNLPTAMTHPDSHVGVSPVTDCHFRFDEDKQMWEARMGVALMGRAHMTPEQFAQTERNPFHPEFHDNICSGWGKTQAAAHAAMEADLHAMADSLWADEPDSL